MVFFSRKRLYFSEFSNTISATQFELKGDFKQQDELFLHIAPVFSNDYLLQPRFLYFSDKAEQETILLKSSFIKPHLSSE